MSSSIPARPRFLLDENVRVELDAFLKENGYFAKRLSKGASDRSLAAASKEERLVLVTNDEDFSSMPAEKVFGVVYLRVLQRDVRLLLTAFRALLAECTEWKGRMIVLHGTQWKAAPLPKKRIERGRVR